MTDLKQKAEQLTKDHSKTELIAIARAKGWKGDPERAYTLTTDGTPIHQKNEIIISHAKETNILATGKDALAYYIAGHIDRHTEQPAAEPAPAQDVGKALEKAFEQPAAEPAMTAAQGAEIQEKLDELLNIGGDYPVLTGKYYDDVFILDKAIKFKKQERQQRQERQQQEQKQMTLTQPTAEQPTDEAAQLLALISKMTQPKKQEIDREQVQQIIVGELESVTAGLAKRMTEHSAELKAEILAQMETRAPRLIEVKANGETVKLEGTQHPMFEKVLKLVSAGLNVMLTGAAGTGKTHLAEQVAKALGRNYGAIHCTAGASESQLMGWLLPSDGGKFEYQAAPFVDLYEQGNSIFLFDEMDAADPNFLLVANGALANGHIHIAQRRHNPSAKRGENVGLMATTNTFGTGADMVYAGRNQLDGATLDRWYIVHIDYQTQLEALIMGATAEPAKQWKPAATDEATVKTDLLMLHNWLNNIRDKATAAKLRRVVSTRAYIKAATARAAGIPTDEIKKDLLAGWSRDELSKVEA